MTVPWSARRHHLPYDYFRFTPEALDYLFRKHGFIDVEVIERGNDFASAFNKILCLLQGLFFPTKYKSLFLTIPIGLLILPSAIVFLIIAHISLLFRFGSKMDPLGYALIAKKPQQSAS
jgi:hypothetical protein